MNINALNKRVRTQGLSSEMAAIGCKPPVKPYAEVHLRAVNWNGV